MNYADLKAAVIGWCNRRNDSQFAAALPNLVALAEADIASSVRARSMVSRATYPIADRYTALPCDWLEFLDVRVAGEPSPLPFASRLDTICMPNQGGRPRAYRLVDGQIEVLPAQSPTASDPPSLEIAYYARPQALVADTDAPALLQEQPAIYQFVLALYGATWLEDDEMTQRFNGLSVAAIAKANEWQTSSRYSGGRINSRARVFG
jgi:hypothetical protein